MDFIQLEVYPGNVSELANRLWFEVPSGFRKSSKSLGFSGSGKTTYIETLTARLPPYANQVSKYPPLKLPQRLKIQI